MTNYRGIVSGWDATAGTPKGVVSPAELRSATSPLAQGEGIYDDPGALAWAPQTGMQAALSGFRAAISDGGGGYYIVQAGDASLTISPANASFPRIDAVYVAQHDYESDSTHPDSELEGPVVLAGTASGTPHAPSVPAGALKLGEILVPANAVSAQTCTWTQTVGCTAPVGAAYPHRRVALFVGDSYTWGARIKDSDDSYRQAHRFSALLSQRFGWEEHNLAENNAGFIVPGSNGHTFLQQLQLAQGQGLTPDIVFVVGGRNDAASDESAAAASCAQFVAVTWPKARCVFIPWGWGNVPLPLDYSLVAQAKRVRDAALSYGQEVIFGAWEWLIGWTDHVDTDQIHPNEAGHAEWARMIALGLQGHSVRREVEETVPPEGSFQNVFNPRWICHEGMVTFQGGFNGQAVAGGQISSIPAWACPRDDQYFPGIIGGASLAIFGATHDGILKVVSWSSGAVTNGFIFPNLPAHPIGQ